MRRVVMFVVLTSLLLAVAGVTAAQEGAFSRGPPSGVVGSPTAPYRESTHSALTVPETTGPDEKTTPTAEDAGAKERPVAKGKKGGGTGGKTAKPKAGGREDNGAVEQDPDDAGAVGGSAKHPGGPKDVGETEGRGGKGRTSGNGNGTKDEVGSGTEGQDKVTICHKGKKTLSVPAPAREAHVRHGDTLGACG